MRVLLLVVLTSSLGCHPNTSSSAGKGTDGGTSPGTGGNAPQSCSTPGITQACCTSGTQTCAGVEFPTWGPCVSASGAVLSCCMPGEFSSCDGGLPPAQGDCQSGEFSSCDGGAPPTPILCQAGGANNEPEILVGYLPASGQTVGAAGQIKVWVNDEGSPIIAPGEVVDPVTGAITTPGNRAAKAPDGYLWEPALYIAPQSAENGGTPHFPSFIKGDYNNTTTKGAGMHVAGMDPPPAGSMLAEKYTAEMIWDVSALGLKPGTYLAEFVIHDGDHDRGVGCVTITIQ